MSPTSYQLLYPAVLRKGYNNTAERRSQHLMGKKLRRYFCRSAGKYQEARRALSVSALKLAAQKTGHSLGKLQFQLAAAR